MKKFIILDSNALVHRAFHALPPLSTKDGRLVNAVYGFTLILMRVLRELNPDYIAATFDLPKPTFRHQMYKEYKATRLKQPEELYNQIPFIKEILRAFRIPILEKEGYEADDLIASLSKLIEKENWKVEDIIVTGDLDTLQLVDNNTKVYSLKKGISEVVIYDPKTVEERFGLRPSQIIDYKALCGDPSDNIPGVKGIGEKTAVELIRKYQSLENLYQALERNEIKDIKPRVKELLQKYKEEAFFGKKLIELVKDIPLEISLKKYQVQKPDIERLRQLFIQFEFYTLLKRLDEFTNEPKNQSIEGAPSDTSLKQLSFNQLVEEAKKNKQIVIDVWLDELSLSPQEGTIFSLKLKSEENEKEALVQKEKWLEIQAILNDSAILKIGYDLKNIIKAIAKFDLSLSLPFFDLMVGAYLLHPDRANDNSIKIDFEDNKKARTETNWHLFQKLEPQLKAHSLINLFEKIEMPLIPVLVSMETTGIKINFSYLKKLSQEFSERIVTLSKEIYQLAGQEFNLNSPVQLREILFDKLKLNTLGKRIRKTTTGKISTAAQELEKLRGTHLITDLIFEYRELIKLQTTYLETLISLASFSPDQRVHTTFNQTAVVTGRLSSSNPNLQNIPIRSDLGRKIRQAFVAEKGYLLLSADYSQIELRLAASLSGDSQMIAAFKGGEDFHAKTAALIFNKPLSEITPEMRRAAKAVNFGILYGMGANSLAEATGFSRAEAEDFIFKYYQTFSQLRRFLDSLLEQARTLGFVETLFGRRRYLPEIRSKMPRLKAAAERMAINMPIQGTAADLMKLAMIRIFQELIKDRKDIRMVLQVHDELVFEVKEELIQEAGKKIKEIMENIYPLRVPLVVDLKVGTNWGEMANF
jgi:DNA polymerase-1